jgi:hypothetical protein
VLELVLLLLLLILMLLLLPHRQLHLLPWASGLQQPGL